MENQIITLPVEVVELATKVNENKRAEVQNTIAQIFAGTDDWERQIDAIEVKGIDDVMSISLAKAAKDNIKKARLAAEKIFDAQRQIIQNAKLDYDLEDKLWLKAKQVMQLKLKNLEDQAAWKANYVQRYEDEQRALVLQKRICEVSFYDTQIKQSQFQNMSDDVFAIFLSGLKTEHTERIENEKKAAEAKLEKDRKHAVHFKRKDELMGLWEFLSDDQQKNLDFSDLSQENFDLLIVELTAAKDAHIAKIEKQRAENERLKKEVDEQKKELAAKNKELEDAKEAKRQLDIKTQAELKAQRESEAKIELEKKQAEIRAKKEAEALAKAPTKEQLSKWVAEFSIPETALDHEKVQLIKSKFKGFLTWAKLEIENL